MTAFLYSSSTNWQDCGRLDFEMFRGSFAVLSVRGGWEATRFPVGEWQASSDFVLRDLAYLLSPTGVSQLPNPPIRYR